MFPCYELCTQPRFLIPFWNTASRTNTPVANMSAAASLHLKIQYKCAGGSTFITFITTHPLLMCVCHYHFLLNIFTTV